MPKSTEIGSITWYSSEPDGGPDVGVSVQLGPNGRLYAGEISFYLWTQLGGADFFPDDSGWYLVHFGPETTVLLAKVAQTHDVQRLLDLVATLARLKPAQ